MAHESGGSPGSAASAAAVEAVCRKVEIDLIDMLGSDGLSALFRRAVHLAEREWPLLTGVKLERTPTSSCTGLSEALAAGTDREAAAVGVAVLAHLLGLLVTLLGKHLGLQPIYRWWPEIASSSGEIHE
jgi:hypothetical protein